MKKTIVVPCSKNQHKSPIHIVKILGLHGGIDNVEAGKFIHDLASGKDIIVDINEEKMEKVVMLFNELNVSFELSEI